ncbi:hypothetical protein Tco_0195834 [Tanacetum coccineum]
MVLDDSCVVLHNFDSYVMGEVKQFSSIGNLRVLLAAEGFVNVRPSYMGGLWVLMELDSISSKTKLMKHVGVASWFSHLCDAQPDFVSKDRIVWVDIEGVPLNAWSRATFNKICARWGDVMDLEESNDGMFARKRICIKTKLEDNILEKFKIIVRDNHSSEDQEVNKPNLVSPQCHSEGFNSRVMQDVSPTVETIISDGNIKDHGPNKGGSILEVLDDMVKVGQAMGFSMGGCLKDMESIIGSQEDLDGLR